MRTLCLCVRVSVVGDSEETIIRTIAGRVWSSAKRSTPISVTWFAVITTIFRAKMAAKDLEITLGLRDTVKDGVGSRDFPNFFGQETSTRKTKGIRTFKTVAKQPITTKVTRTQTRTTALIFYFL